MSPVCANWTATAKHTGALDCFRGEDPNGGDEVDLILAGIGMILVAAIVVATLRVVLRDGYGRVPTRPGHDSRQPTP